MLPQLKLPMFKLVIPSTQKEIMVRPMLVKEEKILLMAKEGEDYGDKLLAVKQVVNNCCQDISVDDLTVFDVEYLFLKIRAMSVDNVVKITFRDEDDGKEREFDIDLNTVEVDFSNKKDNIIMMGEDAGLTLRYPTSKLYDQTKNISTEDDFMNALIVNSMLNYFEGETVYDFTKETQEAMEKFVEDNITSSIYYKIREFLGAVPTLKHEIAYTNDDGESKKIEMNSLNDFFMF